MPDLGFILAQGSPTKPAYDFASDSTICTTVRRSSWTSPSDVTIRACTVSASTHNEAGEAPHDPLLRNANFDRSGPMAASRRRRSPYSWRQHHMSRVT